MGQPLVVLLPAGQAAFLAPAGPWPTGCLYLVSRTAVFLLLLGSGGGSGCLVKCLGNDSWIIQHLGIPRGSVFGPRDAACFWSPVWCGGCPGRLWTGPLRRSALKSYRTRESEGQAAGPWQPLLGAPSLIPASSTSILPVDSQSNFLGLSIFPLLCGSSIQSTTSHLVLILGQVLDQ